jgi:hypothetical protein
MHICNDMTDQVQCSCNWTAAWPGLPTHTTRVMSLGTSVHAIHANFCNNLELGKPRCMPTIAWYYIATFA